MNNFANSSEKTEFIHGGKLEDIKLAHPEQQLEWIDLSTGISPFSYSIDYANIDLKCLPQIINY